MARSVFIGSAVAVPLAVGLAVLANVAPLGRAAILAMYAAAVAIPVLVAAHTEDARRHPRRPGHR